MADEIMLRFDGGTLEWEGAISSPPVVDLPPIPDYVAAGWHPAPWEHSAVFSHPSGSPMVRLVGGSSIVVNGEECPREHAGVLWDVLHEWMALTWPTGER